MGGGERERERGGGGEGREGGERGERDGGDIYSGFVHALVYECVCLQLCQRAQWRDV